MHICIAFSTMELYKKAWGKVAGYWYRTGTTYLGICVYIYESAAFRILQIYPNRTLHITLDQAFISYECKHLNTKMSYLLYFYWFSNQKGRIRIPNNFLRIRISRTDMQYRYLRLCR